MQTGARQERAPGRPSGAVTPGSDGAEPVDGLLERLAGAARSGAGRGDRSLGRDVRDTPSMTGETNLAVLLASMAPELRPGNYVFSTVISLPAVTDLDVLASVIEPEGLSLVMTKEQADRHGLTYDFVAAWITLRVHSALDAVGLTAAVSSALADVGISCNVIAGYHHDHLLVPSDEAHRALAVLSDLAGRATPTQSRQPMSKNSPRNYE